MIPRVLVANVTLAGRTGTEIVARDLALGLQRIGRPPVVYAPTHGALARELQTAGIDVVSSLDAVAVPPDIVHGHHHVQMVEALLRFPGARGLFVCHDRTAPAAAPPRMSRIRRYVAVDLNCRERLDAEDGIPAADRRVILNAVDLDRFERRGPLPRHPRRALVFSHYAAPGTHLDAVRDACARLGLSVDVLGDAAGSASAAPETRLGEYDVVFAKARCALEAMAVGAAVVLCDAAGLGPLVTSGEWAAMRPWNFGARLLTRPLDPEAIARELERYDPRDAEAVCGLTRAAAGLTAQVRAYADLYDEIAAETTPSRGAQDDPGRGGHGTAVGAGGRAGKPDRTLVEYLEATVARIGRLESDLLAYRQPLRMDRLSDDDCGRLTVEVSACDATMAAGATRYVRVRLRNRSGAAIGSHPPYPVQWSYRWLDARSGQLVVAEGVRTALARPAAEGSDSSHAVRVVPPETPGRYRLRLTLVQEWIRWLDDVGPPVSAEALVEVTPGTS